MLHDYITNEYKLLSYYEGRLNYKILINNNL